MVFLVVINFEQNNITALSHLVLTVKSHATVICGNWRQTKYGNRVASSFLAMSFCTQGKTLSNWTINSNFYFLKMYAQTNSAEIFPL